MSRPTEEPTTTINLTVSTATNLLAITEADNQ